MAEGREIKGGEESITAAGAKLSATRPDTAVPLSDVCTLEREPPSCWQIHSEPFLTSAGARCWVTPPAQGLRGYAAPSD